MQERNCEQRKQREHKNLESLIHTLAMPTLHCQGLQLMRGSKERINAQLVYQLHGVG